MSQSSTTQTTQKNDETALPTVSIQPVGSPHPISTDNPEADKLHPSSSEINELNPKDTLNKGGKK